MGLRGDLLWSVGLLIGFNILLSFGAIGLFVRMEPAIQPLAVSRSLEPADEMLACLALLQVSGKESTPRERFAAALAQAQQGASVPENARILAAIENYVNPAFEKDERSVRYLVAALESLKEIHRRSTENAGAKAGKMAAAGAWAMVFLGFCNFMLGLMVFHRFRTRLLFPVNELYAVLNASSKGEMQRRCQPKEAPYELKRIMEDVNALLDRIQRKRVNRQP